MGQGCGPRRTHISGAQPCHMIRGRTVTMDCLKTGENWADLKILEMSQEGIVRILGACLFAL